MRNVELRSARGAWGLGGKVATAPSRAERPPRVKRADGQILSLMFALGFSIEAARFENENERLRSRRNEEFSRCSRLSLLKNGQHAML